MSRFRPDGWTELLTRTFEMAGMEGGLYVEVIAPDLRPGALVLAAAVALLGYVWRQRVTTDGSDSQRSTSHRILAAAILGWLVAWGTWLSVSGNGRYAMALMIFVGPLLGATVLMLPLRNDWRWLLLVLLLGGQLLLLYGAEPSRVWSMLKQDWRETPPFASQDELLGHLDPDLIIFTQSQTMTALLVNTETAKKSKLLSLGFSDSLGPLSAEALAAKDAIQQARRPMLFEAYPSDFIRPSDLSALLWRSQSEELLGAYGLFVSQANCRRQLSSLNVMQVACSLSKGPTTRRLENISSPAIVGKMDQLINRCSNSLWPVGGRYHQPDGGLVQVFRESRYIIKIDSLGVVYVKKRLDLNFVKKIDASDDWDKYGENICGLIVG